LAGRPPWLWPRPSQFVAPGSAQAADRSSAGEWTHRLELSLSPGELGLPAGAPARELARAALERKAGRLGLPKSLRGLRVAREQHVAPGSDGAAEVDPLRFQQTVHGARVLWSQIDVMIAAGYVSSITATVVPVTGKRLAGKRKLSRKRALRIARNAVKGPDDALSPLRVAYAGQPTTRQKHSRTPRPAWVVEVTPAGALDEEVPTPLCVVVDAKTGEVVARWSGIADRPDRGQDSGDALASVRGSAQSSATTPVLDVYDGAGGTQGAPHYARFSPTGDPHVGANWPSLDEAQFFRPRRAELDTLAFNAANVARTICTVRDYCGHRGRFPGVLPWQVAGDVPGSTSSANLSRLIVSISENDVVSFNGFNDVVAHEMGHVRDWVTAGDRIFTEDVQVGAVQEALADMFSYDYDRGDATFGEETALGVARNWADPGAEQELGIPYPAHMRDFVPLQLHDLQPRLLPVRAEGWPLGGRERASERAHEPSPAAELVLPEGGLLLVGPHSVSRPARRARGGRAGVQPGRAPPARDRPDPHPRAVIGSGERPRASAMDTSEGFTVDARYRGFPDVAHGGYVSGVLARSLGDGAEVVLRRPPPIGRQLEIERDGPDRVVLRDGESVVAEATRAELKIDTPRVVTFDEAEAASRAYPGHSAHPFPSCFCCGPEREPGDGLRIFPGQLAGSEIVAAPFIPDAALADDSGALGSELTGAAVDCPQLWALMIAAPPDSSERVVTSGLAATLRGPLRADQRYIVIAWPAGREGNRLYADAAVLTENGDRVAVGRQTAAVVGTDWGVPLGLDNWRSL